MYISASEAAKAAGGSIVYGDPRACITGISTDSNRTAKGDLFVPLIGRRTDGHRYIRGALANGASVSLTSEELPSGTMQGYGGAALIRVDDTLSALQSLASYYRDTYVRIPYIGITGSVGKTTTREMTVCALSPSFKCYSTRGNANSQVGVPVTVAGTPEDAECGVIEMGISEFGEMERLSRIVKCDAAAVTRIDISHMAQLKSRSDIMREKLHICDDMPDGGVLILNGDDDLLGQMTVRKLHELGIARGRYPEIRFFGTGSNAYLRAEDIRLMPSGSACRISIGGKAAGELELRVPGRHMLMNALAAAAAASAAGADIDKAIAALGGFESLEGRGRITTVGGVRIISDAYNASPVSMEAGLRVLDGLDLPPGGRRIAVLSDMLELGDDEIAYHRSTGSFIARSTRIDVLLAYGKLSGYMAAAAEDAGRSSLEVRLFRDRDELSGYLVKFVKSGDAVLFKASNSMGLSGAAGDLERELDRAWSTQRS